MSPKCLSPKRLVSVVAQWSCHPIVRRPWQLSYSSVLVRVLVDIGLMNHWRTKALNAPLFALIQPSLETVDLFSFYHMVWQAVPYIHNSSTDIKTTSEFVQFIGMSLMIVTSDIQFEEFSLVYILFSC